jgi:hypothetical protein
MMPWGFEIGTSENSISYTIKYSKAAIQKTGFLLDILCLDVIASSRFPAGTN